MELVEQRGGAEEMNLFLFPQQHRSQNKQSQSGVLYHMDLTTQSGKWRHWESNKKTCHPKHQLESVCVCVCVCVLTLQDLAAPCNTCQEVLLLPCYCKPGQSFDPSPVAVPVVLVTVCQWMKVRLPGTC